MRSVATNHLKLHLFLLSNRFLSSKPISDRVASSRGCKLQDMADVRIIHGFALSSSLGRRRGKNKVTLLFNVNAMSQPLSEVREWKSGRKESHSAGCTKPQRADIWNPCSPFRSMMTLSSVNRQPIKLVNEVTQSTGVFTNHAMHDDKKFSPRLMGTWGFSKELVSDHYDQ